MTSLERITMLPVGIVRSPRTQRRDDFWGAVESTIELDPAQYTADALAGLGEFSHLEVVYHFHGVKAERIVATARHPRNNPDWPKVGIFAQRGSSRPNRIGISRCRILAVEALTVRVRELDAIDGTPVLDLKPYLAEFAPVGQTYQPRWATELMQRYYDE